MGDALRLVRFNSPGKREGDVSHSLGLSLVVQASNMGRYSAFTPYKPAFTSQWPSHHFDF